MLTGSWGPRIGLQLMHGRGTNGRCECPNIRQGSAPGPHQCAVSASSLGIQSRYGRTDSRACNVFYNAEFLSCDESCLVM
jgi:hypothetical protein